MIAALIFAAMAGWIGAGYLPSLLSRDSAVANNETSSAAKAPSNAAYNQSATVTPALGEKDNTASVEKTAASGPVITSLAAPKLPRPDVSKESANSPQMTTRSPDERLSSIRLPEPPDADLSKNAPSTAPLIVSTSRAYFTGEDVARVVQIATQKKMQMPTYQIEQIDPSVPANLRRYVGIWVSKVGFNGGLGPEALLIVSDIDGEGRVNGWYVSGPPTPKSYDQRPAFYIPVAGKVKEDLLSIETTTAKASIRFSVSNALSIKWARKDGRSASNILYPVWILSEHERH
jgi:hypothetical protein